MLIGHEHIIDFLEKTSANNQLASCYLFYGKEHLGKTTVAEWFIKKILNVNDFSAHPDVITLVAPRDQKTEAKQSIGVDALRECIEKLMLTPLYGRHLILFIKEAEAVSAEGWHLLLKTLEEPRPSVIIILVAQRIDEIPKTALSRLLKILFLPVPEAELYRAFARLGVDEAGLKTMVAKSFGCPGMMMEWSGQKNEDRVMDDLFQLISSSHQTLAERLQTFDDLNKQELSERFDRLLIIFRDIILFKMNLTDCLIHGDRLDVMNEMARHYTIDASEAMIEKLIAAKSLLEQNAHPRLVTEDLMLAFE